MFALAHDRMRVLRITMSWIAMAKCSAKQVLTMNSESLLAIVWTLTIDL